MVPTYVTTQITEKATTAYDDGKRRWRKYGEKRVKMDHGGTCRRSYYRCSAFHGCPARKLEDCDVANNGGAASVSYQGDHVHCEVIIDDLGIDMSQVAAVPAMQVLGNYGTTPVVTMTAATTSTTSCAKPPLSKPKTTAGIKRRYRQLSELSANVASVPSGGFEQQANNVPSQMQTGSGGFACRTIDWHAPDLYQAAAVNTPSGLPPQSSHPTAAVASMNPAVNDNIHQPSTTTHFWGVSTQSEMAAVQNMGNISIRSLLGENAIPMPLTLDTNLSNTYRGFSSTDRVGLHTAADIPIAKVVRPSFHGIPSPTGGLPSPTCLSSPA